MRNALILVRRVLFFPMRLISIVQFAIAGVNLKGIAVEGLVTLSNSGVLKIGKQTKINSSKYKNVIGGDTRTSLVIHKGADLIIGREVKISNSSFQCKASIVIEDYVMIGGNCKIWDTDFHSIDPVIRRETPNDGANSSPIHIKENAFIGGSSIVLKGVTIGKNSVVAAGSVVSKSIPDNEVWGGNPAKLIRKL